MLSANDLSIIVVIIVNQWARACSARLGLIVQRHTAPASMRFAQGCNPCADISGC
jgi:hypothetical protein